MKRRKTITARLTLADCVILEQALAEYARGNVAYLSLLTRLYKYARRAQKLEGL